MKLINVRNFLQKKENKIWDYYYDAMECLTQDNAETAKLLLKKTIKLDENFVAGYVGMTAVYRVEGNNKREKEYSDLAYKKTCKIFPRWPKKMNWGILENRQYLRAICDKAAVYHKKDDYKEAEKLYRLLLKLNPNDNQGVRYLLAGMFVSLSPQDVDDMFDECNAKQDWSKLEKLVEEQNKKHHFWTEPSS